MAPLCKKDCIQALHTSLRYINAVPYPLFDHKYSPTPGVALSRTQIDAAINDDNSTLEDFPMQRVAVPTGETDFASFQVLSPEEIRIAKVCNFVADTNLARCLKMRRGHSEDIC